MYKLKEEKVREVGNLRTKLVRLFEETYIIPKLNMEKAGNDGMDDIIVIWRDGVGEVVIQWFGVMTQ